MNTKIKKFKIQWILIAIVAILSVSFCACAQQNKIEEGKYPNTIAENAKVPDQYKQISEEMTNFTITEFTENISKIPRQSGSVEKIMNYIYNWGISHNVKTTKDASGCIYYDVPATSGFENYPTIILQSHTDMVQTTADASIDMNTTPIDIIMDEETGALHSRDYKTNIGADDAEGMTALMILSINKNYNHGPLRMLFTFDEETTMEGAMNISPEVMSPNYLLNVDGGPVGSACMSSAGVFKCYMTKQYTQNPSSLYTKLNISMKDFSGGHSGIEIIKDKLSANVVTNQILQKLIDEEIHFQLASAKGGNAPNVIANAVDFTILVDAADSQKAQEIINNEFQTKKQKSQYDKDAIIEITEAPASACAALSENDTKSLIEFLNKLPHGLRERDAEFTDKPAVSSNLGMMVLENGSLEILIHSRSNIEGRNTELDSQLRQTCGNFGVNYEVLAWYEAWPKSEDKSLLNLWNKSYKDTCNIESCEYTTHGGLECSWFLQKNPNIQMLSVGMDVADEHAVTEKLYTKSIPVFYACLLNFLENANQL